MNKIITSNKNNPKKYKCFKRMFILAKELF